MRKYNEKNMQDNSSWESYVKVRGHMQNTSFSSQLTNGPNKLEHFQTGKPLSPV